MYIYTYIHIYIYIYTYTHTCTEIYCNIATEHATSAAAEFGGEIHNVSRNRARTQVLPQAQKSHVFTEVARLVPSGLPDPAALNHCMHTFPEINLR